jgi:hypothetical protein
MTGAAVEFDALVRVRPVKIKRKARAAGESAARRKLALPVARNL